jgi:glycosyltransferase involved in cell wall biosynthesis
VAPLPAARARILHVHKVAGLGGSERHLQILLPRLDRRRFDVSLFLLTEPRRPVTDYIAYFRGMGICVDHAAIRSDLDPSCLLALYRRLRQEPVDLVHTHLIHADLYGLLASRLAGIRRVVSTRHNDDAFRRRADVRAVTRLAGLGWSRVIALSRYLADFIRHVEGVDPGLIRTVPYGMEPPEPTSDGYRVREELGLSCEVPLVVSVGRLVKQKGHSHLLRAWPAIARAMPHARLLVVGEGPWRARLAAEAKALGVSDHVVFAGWRFDVPAILAAADLYVQPSLWEGFGLAILEAMAAGTCVVASRVSTIPEVVLDDQTGSLVPPGDCAGLAEAILRLLADPKRRYQMGEAGRRRVMEAFSAERMARATEAVYEEVLSLEGLAGRAVRGRRERTPA